MRLLRRRLFLFSGIVLVVWLTFYELSQVRERSHWCVALEHFFSDWLNWLGLGTTVVSFEFRIVSATRLTTAPAFVLSGATTALR